MRTANCAGKQHKRSIALVVVENARKIKLEDLLVTEGGGPGGNTAHVCTASAARSIARRAFIDTSRTSGHVYALAQRTRKGTKSETQNFI